MKIHKATETYETWLVGQIPLIRAEVEKKHELMKEAVFPFLLATFYRWVQTFPEHCENLMEAPTVLGVGDLHVENFGTWRDIEGRLIWGINDFDEACRLPYTCDLVRLATSAHLAVQGGHIKISDEKASSAILAGYRAGLDARGKPFVLAEHRSALRDMARERLKDPSKFWQKLHALPTLRGKIPSGVQKALRRQWPEEGLKLRFAHRVSGLGSLGRRRFVAIAEWRGASIAREAKELAVSAWRWARSRKPKDAILYQEILDQAIRCPDPFVHMRGGWIVRRLAPDCSRIEMDSLPAKHDAMRLLHAMGWETANIHLGACDARTLKRDLDKRGPGWLHGAAERMVQSTMEDWKAWRKG